MQQQQQQAHASLPQQQQQEHAPAAEGFIWICVQKRRGRFQIRHFLSVQDLSANLEAKKQTKNTQQQQEQQQE